MSQNFSEVNSYSLALYASTTHRMDDPKLYHGAHELQRQDGEKRIEEFLPKLQWRPEGGDTLIDIGSGPGDVLMECVYPKIPKNFQRLVCSDIKASMMEYAKSNYQHLDPKHRLEFRVLDIGSSRELPKDLEGQFDHLTSFYCLQLVPDLRQCFRNIYNLLRPEGGDCFIIFAPWASMFDAYLAMSKTIKWSAYMQDVDHYTSALQHSKDTRQDVIDLLEETGFKDYIVEKWDREFIYTLEDYKRSMKAISPYIPRIPPSMHDEFLDDYVKAVINTELDFELWNKKENTFCKKYQQMVIYAKKPCVSK